MDVKSTDQCSTEFSPLMEAVDAGDMEHVQDLLRKGADPNYVTSACHESALTVAAKNDDMGANDECSKDAADGVCSDDGKKVEELIWTRTAVDTFLIRRSEDKYRNVLKAFVIEAMTTERCAAFPSSAEIVLAFFEGKGPFSSAIVRDGAGRPYLAFLTDHVRKRQFGMGPIFAKRQVKHGIMKAVYER